MKIKHMPAKKSRLSKAQRDFLDTYFEVNPHPNTQERAYIASQSLVSEEKIRNWFQNRRTRERGDCKIASHRSAFSVNTFEENTSSVHPTSNDLYIRR
ncbi:ECU03_1395 [Encephalitozoon cuniculi GB-M1]|uniref:Homeobox protein HD-9 n=1 Tax=Encephalitozoon cuniculi (strain GB-M1) TaxID=284813 RepID=HD9_ENCCU|nr:uncharacterized protein ECU03_1395 [Encephalitozoon cuniculi GB-M1]Q7SI91.1 RecName: Full=Homeobox protein HD-9; AltName: Full=EcHD-9 [Encephalitozoon cuniculi GB-M1]CCI73919.1 ECU03_1395 [Encephalitozoon cuniculi GB-M1]DAA01301.1 TPA_exp: homeodomain protein EcHD-9 [Encephalitozoon cuniculi]